MKYGIDAQKEIYLQGMSGIKPIVPTIYEDLVKEAKEKMSAEGFAYIAGGAGMEKTMKANLDAFDHYKLNARMMQGSVNIDMSIHLLGKKYDTPIMAAPIGALELAHPIAEKAVATACRELNIPMIFSNQASVKMETCASELGSTPRWFQLYWSKSDDLVQSFVSRAEKCDCEAIVVTLDTTTLGWRTRDLDLGYLPFLRGEGLAQYSSDPIFNAIVEERMKNKVGANDPKPPITLTTIENLFKVCKNYPGGFLNNLTSGKALAAVKTFIDIYMRPELEWADIKRLRKMTKLPILVKGIHHIEDAKMAIDAGVDGMIISNHGGRQVDGGVGALTALDEIALELKGKAALLFDSGIRSGADVIKALALGADAVLIGRPFAFGVAIAQERGATAVFKHFLSEIEIQLSLMGIKSISELNRNVLAKDSE
ncbi:MAG: alpha-hydroxy-acid oxidizing protein [Chitinophagales bacterium]|nr:alpha-hydroxy-acid oxidizing protein [Chitinophagales bacterium]